MKQVTKAWAIRRTIEGHDKPFFQGIFWEHHGELPPYQDGMRTCLYRTRKQATEARRKIGIETASVVRVTVTIKG
jgi:hypothetical protein